MQNKTIYIIRHGKPFSSVKQYLGQINCSLSKLGMQQAHYLRKYFSYIRLDGIYSSDLIRAAKTAEIISKEHSVKIEYVPEIREVSLGKWDGVNFNTIRKKYPISFHIRGLNLEHYRPPNGENFTDLRNRIIPVFHKIIKNTNRRSVVISHAGVNRVIIATILKIPLNEIFQIKQDYAATNKIIVIQGKKKLHI